jgi:hypothetical protein
MTRECKSPPDGETSMARSRLRRRTLRYAGVGLSFLAASMGTACSLLIEGALQDAQSGVLNADEAGASEAASVAEAASSVDSRAGGPEAAAPLPDGGPAIDAGIPGTLPSNAILGSCNPGSWRVSASGAEVDVDDAGPFVATPPERAIDGLEGSRWTTGEAQTYQNLYYQFDFGGYVFVNSITIENSYYSASDFPVAFDLAAASDDTFSDYRSLVDGGVSLLPGTPQPLLTVTFPTQATSVLRIQLLQSDTSPSWWSMEEVHIGCEVPDAGAVFDGDVEDAALPPFTDDGGGDSSLDAGVNPNRINWAAWAWPSYSTNIDDQLVLNAFDDLPDGAPNLATRWSDGRSMIGDEYFILDLGQAVTMNSISMTSDVSGTISDSVRAWELQFSTDGMTWTAGPGAYPPGPEGTNGSSNAVAAVVVRMPFPTTSARYIRINQLGASGQWWAITDITVHGN